MYFFGERGDFNRLIECVDSAKIRGRTSPARRTQRELYQISATIGLVPIEQ